MNTLVTGATGFLGRHLVRALVARGDTVVRLVRDHLRVRVSPEGFVDVDGSVTDMPLLERAIAEYEVDAVVHLAAQAQVSVAEKDPVGTLETNVRGTWSVLEACRRQGVKRVVVASSDKAYGDGPVPYVEGQALLPHGVYATSKACADMLAQSYLRDFGMSIAITRCANLYGPEHTNWSTLIPGTVRSVLKGERPIIRSDGALKRDYLFVGDAVEAYLALLDARATGAFNFGTGIASSVLKVVTAVLGVCESHLEPDVRGEAPAKMEIHEQCVDSCKARKIGWYPRHTLVEGLLETVPWYKGFLGAA